MICVNIIGSGLAGLSAARTLANNNISSNLISVLPSERAQSVLAEGGINGALNTMGEEDRPEYHMEDTLKAGVYIADEEAVRALTRTAPAILKELKSLGVPFNLKDEQVQQRNFGGQKKKRTAYARSSTGKALMSALIDDVRKFEAAGTVKRFSNHEFITLRQSCGRCVGVTVKNTYNGQFMDFDGPVIMACGGMNGLFPGMTTGTTANTGDAAAELFSLGVRFSSLEMIQYHPTTIGISGKRCLVSEAARGEGGRLFVMRGGEPWFFMEEKYPELGNLMPRDVVAREMYFTVRNDECGNQVYLEMRHLPKETWKKKLPDLREEIVHYLGMDPAAEPIPVDPGIHYFMGGIDVDINHQTSMTGLYAAGECCSQYHGANRLGGNSTMGAIYGGMRAAETVAAEVCGDIFKSGTSLASGYEAEYSMAARAEFNHSLRDIMLDALGIVRNEMVILRAIEKLRTIFPENIRERHRLMLAQAILESALYRKESRGAHYRSDYPEKDEKFRGMTTALYDPESGNIITGFRKSK